MKKAVDTWKHMEACEEGCRRVEACGTHELDPRIFGWRVMARAISNGFKASTKL